MKPISSVFAAFGFCLALGLSNTARSQNFQVARWINEAGVSAATVINTNGIFITDYKGRNDLTVTSTNPGSVALYTDVFGGSGTGNNPGYLTNFTGVSGNGTGNGVVGDIEDFEMTYGASSTIQFDFALPLTSQDRILLIDVDGTEQYYLQAYIFNGASYVPADLTGWIAEEFSGSTGTLPNSNWPVWNAAAGTVTSPAGASLNEELFSLTPNQSINRLVITKQAGNGYSTSVSFISLNTPLAIQKAGSNVVMTWTNTGFILQTAPTVTGAFTNIPGATSPYTNATTGSQKFFRLE